MAYKADMQGHFYYDYFFFDVFHYHYAYSNYLNVFTYLFVNWYLV